MATRVTLSASRFAPEQEARHGQPSVIADVRHKNMHPRSFFKYSTSAVAKIVLSTLQIRWSSPRLFNDPFDCVFSLSPKFNFSDVKPDHKDRFINLLTQEEEPKIDWTNQFALMFAVMRIACRSRTRTEIEAIVTESFELYLSEETEQVRKETDLLWKQEYDDLRLLCVCEAVDNILLWSHYGDSHKGVAIEFQCIEELDVPLLAAEPVRYSKDVPSMATEDEWIQTALGLAPMADGMETWKRLVYTKAEDWSYEREWRVVTKRRGYESIGYEDTSFDPREISKIYLGCRIDDDDKSELLSKLAGPLEHVEAYQAIQNPKKYSLTFEKIK